VSSDTTLNDTPVRPPQPAMPRLVGHRGAAGHAPENTLVGFQVARDLGVTWVEFDTKLAGCGEVVLFHDRTLERTTDGHGAVGETPYAEIAKLDAGGWFDPAFAGERVPTLSMAIARLAELGLGANVEIKPSPGSETETGVAVARLLQAEWPASLPPPVLSSFSQRALEAAAATAPEIARAHLSHFPVFGWRASIGLTGAGALHANHRSLTPQLCAAIKSDGMPLRAFTVNEADRAAELFEWGVDALFTDYPDRLAETVPNGSA
jgi:glycerophosphoryl diester phosphodiesterase